jgi:imidazolonepropionase-like amidohydrolase
MRRILTRLGLVGLGLVALLFVVLVILAKFPLPERPAPRLAGRLAIENVSVIDVEEGVALPGRTVVIDAGRIVAVGDSRGIGRPADAIAIDGTGKFLIPGLWDMHVHHGGEMSPWLTMPLFIATGVTGIRDMGGGADRELKERWREEIRTRTLLGPRTPGRAVRSIFSLPDAESARAVVAGLEPGHDFIKIFNGLLPEPYFALLDEAGRRGVPVVGHRPRAIAAIDAVRAGQKSFEHARHFLFECFDGAADLREAYRARFANEAGGGSRLDDTDALRAMIDRHSPRMFDNLAAAMVGHDTWFCPTHITRKMDAFADDETFRTDPRLRFIPLLQRLEWKQDADGMIARDPSPRGRATYTEFYEKGLELTGRAHDAGVKLLSGTDANDTYCFPGFSLHDELQELVHAGLTPAEALQTATINPAAYFGLSEGLGSIAEGKVADLVLLDANPLEEIANTHRIRAVFYDGGYYTRRDLDRMLDGVERQAGSLRVAARTIWNNVMD